MPASLFYLERRTLVPAFRTFVQAEGIKETNYRKSHRKIVKRKFSFSLVKNIWHLLQKIFLALCFVGVEEMWWVGLGLYNCDMLRWLTVYGVRTHFVKIWHEAE